MEYRSRDILVINRGDILEESIKILQQSPFTKAVTFDSSIDPACSQLYQAIDNHPRIETFNIARKKSDLPESSCLQLAEWLSTTSKVKKLFFEDSIRIADTWRLIFDAINKSKSITELSFNYKSQFYGTEFLIQNIKTNTAIRTLKINFDSDRVSIKSILRALVENNTLTSVKLSKIQSTDSDLLCAMLQQNKQLKYLHLDNGNIEGDGLERFINALKKNGSVASFGLSRNPLTDDGCKLIARIMTEVKLKELVLDNVKLSSEGSRTILEAVKHDRTLKKLNLSSNPLDSAATLINDLLKINTTLTELHMSRCNLKGMMETVSVGLTENQTLRTLAIEDNGFHYNDTMAMCAVLHRNKGLTSLNMSKAPFIQSNSGSLCDAVEKNKVLIDVQANVKGWIFGYTTRLATALKVNRNHQNTVVVNRAIIILNIARSQPQQLLPELWAYIFSFDKMPGVHINWGTAVREAFANPGRTKMSSS